MADIIKDSYNEANRFTKVLFQRGRDVIDFELNEFQDDLRVMTYRAMSNGVQETLLGSLNPGSNDADGWRVIATGAANAVNLGVGYIFVDGIPLFNASLLSFAGFTTNPGPGVRLDVVYLEVTEVEVADPAQMPQLGETTKRRQLQVTVNVSITGYAGVPANTANDIWEGGVHYFPIAEVTRAVGVAAIAAIDVVDARKLLPPSVIEQITRQVGFDVVSVVSELYESPVFDFMQFSLDPNGLYGPGDTCRWDWTLRAIAGPSRLMARLQEEPAGPWAYTGLLRLDTGVTYSNLTTLLFHDGNIQGAPVTTKVAPFSETGVGAANCLRKGEIAYDAATPSLTASVLRSVNGRFTVTCGDGVVSFGDFNGATAVETAMVFYNTHVVPLGVRDFHIQLKHGTFDLLTTGVLLNSTDSITIEGVDVTGSKLRGNSAVLDPMMTVNTSTSKLTLKNLTVVGVNLTSVEVQGAFSAQDVVFDNVLVLALNATPREASSPAVLCERCTFINSDTSVIISVSDNLTTHVGHVFRSCFFRGKDDSPICVVRAEVASTGLLYLEGIRFDACRFECGSTTGSAVLTGNSGVLEVFPNGVTPVAGNVLNIKDIVFHECVARVVGAGAAKVLLHVNATGTNLAFTGAGVAYARVEYIEISGGSWLVEGSTTASPIVIATADYGNSIVSSTVAAKPHVVIRDVRVGMNISTSGAVRQGGSPNDAIGYFDTAAIADSRFACIAVRSHRITISNVECRSFSQLGTVGDWRVHGELVSIDGIRMEDYATGGPGTMPYARFQLGRPRSTVMAESLAPTYSVRNVVLKGENAGASDWCEAAGGFFVLHPNWENSIVNDGRVTSVRLSNLQVYGFTVAGVQASTPGFRFAGSGTAGTNESFANVDLSDSFFARNAGIVYLTPGAGDPPHFSGVSVASCRVSRSISHGISFLCTPGSQTRIWRLVIRDNDCTNCDLSGIVVRLADTTPSQVDIIDNRCADNTAASEIEYTSAGTSVPSGRLAGNDTRGAAGALSSIKFSGAAAVTYATGGFIGFADTAFAILGVETRYAPSANLRRVLVGEAMIHNSATVVTP